MPDKGEGKIWVFTNRLSKRQTHSFQARGAHTYPNAEARRQVGADRGVHLGNVHLALCLIWNRKA